MLQTSAPKHIVFILASILTLAAQTAPAAPRPTLSPTSAPSDAAIRAPLPAYRFPERQTFTYAVEWRLFDAGVATIRIDPAAREHRVTATADAKGVVGLLYHVRDRFESFFDPVTNCSRVIEKKTEEGFRRLETNIVFDGTRKKSILTEKNLRNSQSKRVENDIPGCVTDVATAIFYIASQPLTPGATVIFPLNDGGKTVHVQTVVEAREVVKLSSGTFNTLRVQATGASATTKNKGQVWIWYSDDERRTPVQMRAKLFWGTLTFRMK